MEFYIEKLTATGPGKEASSIEFKPGLNIICGASDTGKTAVLKSIKFLFGGDKPFDKDKKGFNCITMVIRTLSGAITLSRYIGKNTIDVKSDIDEIQSGVYDVSYNDKKGNEHPVIHKLWLSLMGCDDEPMIICNQRKERKHFTMTNILRSFYISEDDITESASVILPLRAPASEPLFLSAMLYLFTGNEYSGLESEESDAVSNARKSGMELYAHERIQELTVRIDQLEGELATFDGIDVEYEMSKEIDSLADIDKKLSEQRSRLLAVVKQINGLDDNSVELELILSRHNELQSQYAADIKRLTFIVDGENITHAHPQSTRCPFCDGTLNPKERTSYIEASKTELRRIMTQAKGLSQTTNEIQAQLDEIKQERESLLKEKANIKTLIDSSLAPQAAKLKKDIAHYRRYLQLQQEYSVVKEISSNLNTKLIEQVEKVTEKDTDTYFKPRKHFPTDFADSMSTIAFKVLSGCNYPDLNTVEFNLGKFDLVINGDDKSEGHGKGYRAFINTALGLALRQYYHDNAKYKPGLFIVDTPQHGLNQGNDDDNPQSMKHGLFTYLIENKKMGQTIIVENIEHLPDIDFEAKGINVVDYTHDNYDSKFKNHRYGFLIGVTN